MTRASTLTTNTHKESIAHLGEIELIERIKAWLGPVNSPTPKGIGDDCAVLDPILKGQQLITTDAISYEYHFDDNISAKDAGAKLIKRNLSDIAAMGGAPESAALALLCGSNTAVKWLEDFFAGIRETCKRYSISIVGGDISTLKENSFSAVLTLTGYALAPKLRTSSRINDHIYVTGTLGGSLLGKHFQFEPRIAEGQWLGEQQGCRAMMDLSDGLGKDLQALLPTNTSAHLHLDRIPVSEAALKLAQTSGLQALEHVFRDGEDYELLFTLNADTNKSEFEKNWQQKFPNTLLTRIGSIRDASAKGPYLDAKTKNAIPWTHGFEHLKS